MMIGTPQCGVILSGVPPGRDEVEGSAVAFRAAHSRHDEGKGTNLMRSTKLGLLFASLLFLFAGALAHAATVSGTVTNMTTNKPAAGDVVTLLEPMSGMSEAGHATTNAQGRYTLNLPGEVPYLVRVTHQGAEYFIAAPQGGGTGDISVYDVAAKVEGITIAEHVTGIETDNGQLRVVERYDIHNASSPPRTQWSKQSFQVILPDDAVVGDASAQRPGASSLPTSVKLNPDGPKGHYSFDFPIQPDQEAQGHAFPGSIQSAVQQREIQLSFAGDAAGGYGLGRAAEIDDIRGRQRFGIRVVAAGPQRADIPGRNVASGQGAGIFGGRQRIVRPRRAERPGRQRATLADKAQRQGQQPGGGIGEPINTPDPLSKYKWWILGGLALLLAACGGVSAAQAGDGRNRCAAGCWPERRLEFPSVYSAPGLASSSPAARTFGAAECA